MAECKSFQKGTVFSNLTWSPQIAQRLKPRESGLPGWFGHGILMAGYDFRCEMNPTINVLRRLFRLQMVTLLCFNPSLIYGLLFLLPLPVNRVSLFQWRPIGRLSYWKSLFVWMILKRSHAVAVYSHTSGRYIRRYFPGRSIQQIGLYVDTEYFHPSPTERNNNDFVFVPGDHKRNESLVVDVAKKQGVHVVRVTRNLLIREAIEEMRAEEVEVRFNVSFDELRILYQTCRYVLILSDSSEIPTGITTLAEALACGADVVISRGQSNSWPPEMNGKLPFISVPAKSDAETLSNVVCQLSSDTQQKSVRVARARNFAVAQFSGSAVGKQWGELLDFLPYRLNQVSVGCVCDFIKRRK